MFDLTHIIIAFQRNHPEFAYEDIQILCEDFLSSLKKVKKQETQIKRLLRYLEEEFEADMSSIDITTGWLKEHLHEIGVDHSAQPVKQKKEGYHLDNLPLQHFQGHARKKTDCLIRIMDLHKALGTTSLFEGTNFQINGQDKVALMGRNGIGKSTLLRILIGREDLDDGEMMMSSDVKVGYLSQDLMWESENNTLSYEIHESTPELHSCMQKWQKNNEDHEILEKIENMNGFKLFDLQEELLRYFGFEESDLWKKISEFSGGQQIRIQIAKCILQDVDVLILDEPTNHLDIQGIMFLEKFCEMWNKAMICISHDKKFIDTIFSSLLEISEKKLNPFNGNYDAYILKKKQDYESTLRKFEAQEEYIEKQEKFIAKFRYKASTAGQVQSRIKMLEKMEKIEKPDMDLAIQNITLQVDIRMPQVLMSIKKLEIGYNNNPLVSIPSEITIEKDQKIAIIGENGCWKSTLLETIVGRLKPIAGEISKHEKVRIGYFSQIADTLDANKSILQECSVGRIKQGEIYNLLAGLLINPEKIHQKINTLSGGERAKVALIKMILQRPHLLIMDEPTNHLDIQSKQAVQKMLAEFPGSVLLVSHDRDFLENTCERMWVFNNGNMEILSDFQMGFRKILD